LKDLGAKARRNLPQPDDEDEPEEMQDGGAD
jgi:hypothetical protein